MTATMSKIAFLFLLIGCRSTPDIQELLKTTYEEKMISSGDNRPMVSLSKENLKELLILLHHRIPLRTIQEHFGWDDASLRERLNLLLENDFLKEVGPDTYLPTTMVIDLREGEDLKWLANQVAEPIADYLANHVDAIRHQVAGIPAFRDIPFENISFFVMSDVLLDNWQINNIERSFIESERTPRHGVHYYHSLQEKDPESNTEAFGIYGNQMWGNGSTMAGVYGNKRSTSRSILNLKTNDFMETFGMPESASLSEFKGNILEALVRYSQNTEQPLDSTITKGLADLGLWDGTSLTIPVLQRSDYDSLSALARLYTTDIAEMLREKKEVLRDEYVNSRYAEEITFEEYLIWWYHFLYTEVTNQLAQRGIISIPSTGIVTYVVKWSD